MRPIHFFRPRLLTLPALAVVACALAPATLADRPSPALAVEAEQPAPPVLHLGRPGAGGSNLHWTVFSSTEQPVEVFVEIANSSGVVVRHVDARIDRLPRGGVHHGFTKWDGKSDSGALVPPGTYHYRVVAVDHAGNISQSGESKPLQVKVS